MPAVEVPLWRAVAVFRALALAYAAAVLVRVQGELPRPGLAWAVVAAMALWTAAAVPLYARAPRDRVAVLDVVLAACAVLSTALVDAPERIDRGTQTLPIVWPAAAVLAAAVVRGPWAGAGAALVVGAAGLAVRGEPAPTTLHNALLLLLAGAIVGWAVRRARDAEERLAREQRRLAAAQERDRLARVVHDGVLQVLALVGRRAGDGVDPALARLAAEQEAALRSLVAGRAAAPGGASRAAAPPAELDLVALVRSLAGPGAQVAAPAGAVELPAATARELAAAVGAALDNARRHAPGAPVWVLVDDEGDAVTVVVRDEGPGVAPGRLEEAVAAGRLGVAQSIVGRVRDLGGAASVASAPGTGTTVELRVPR
ncbi:MacS family sensor histidine kinase [Vallicoccus soli]|uniref:Sensor histidine kinase n=1 Tax=Vallicoccus soli TaxID=2339232 RepID=A0A3A3Z2C1_9ACTN|nr:DUF5931 domain-containing protein [Vallicoccus soli]RJK96874.1 sensor histidine kinase [Vallicoccus soli]